MIVSEHGINATLGGTVEDLKQYVKTTRRYPGFEGVDVKWSDGTGRDFPRLSVKVRPELVAFGVPDEVRVDEHGVVGGGERLSPQALHDLVEERGDDVVMLDGRNAFEAAIGRFRGAVVPDVATTRDFVAEIDSGRYDDLKGRPVVTYCGGACGARCCRRCCAPAGSRRSTSSTAASCAMARCSARRDCGRGRSTCSTSACTSSSAGVDAARRVHGVRGADGEVRELRRPELPDPAPVLLRLRPRGPLDALRDVRPGAPGRFDRRPASRVVW